MAGSYTDLFAALQNGVRAVQTLTQKTLRNQGQYTSQVYTAQAVVTTGSGRLVSFSVLVAGAAGTINNSSTTSGAGSTNAICATPATVGIFTAGLEFTHGLVVSPGAGQSVCVTYSIDGSN